MSTVNAGLAGDIHCTYLTDPNAYVLLTVQSMSRRRGVESEKESVVALMRLPRSFPAIRDIHWHCPDILLDVSVPINTSGRWTSCPGNRQRVYLSGSVPVMYLIFRIVFPDFPMASAPKPLLGAAYLSCIKRHARCWSTSRYVSCMLYIACIVSSTYSRGRPTANLEPPSRSSTVPTALYFVGSTTLALRIRHGGWPDQHKFPHLRSMLLWRNRLHILPDGLFLLCAFSR